VREVLAAAADVGVGAEALRRAAARLRAMLAAVDEREREGPPPLG
jgi:hypothetical protein